MSTTPQSSIDRTQEIIKSINNLKDVEASLYAQLQTTSNSPNPDQARQQQLINSINDVISTRAQLYKNLNDMYIILQTSVDTVNSSDIFNAQQNAITLIESELEKAEKNKKILETDKNNKMRMAQINTFYSKHYEANTNVMKSIVYIAVPLMILAVLKNKELMPISLINFLTVIILTFGGIRIGKQVYDIALRRDDDFDKYDWNFNADSVDTSRIVRDPVDLSSAGGTNPLDSCYGANCCDGTTNVWNVTVKKCMPVAASASTTTSVTSTPPALSGSTTTSTVATPSASTGAVATTTSGSSAAGAVTTAGPSTAPAM
jgi:hypothetical protein